MSASWGKPIVVRMPPDLHEAIKAKAAREERSMAQAIRHALRLYTARGADTPATKESDWESPRDHEANW